MSIRKHWIWGAVAACAVLALVVVGVFRWRGPKVTVAAAARRLIVMEVIVSGRVLSPSRINVGSMASGIVTQVAVREGDHVAPGALLVQLDDAGARAALLVAKAGLQQAQARIGLLKHTTGPMALQTHRQADANLIFARLNYERLTALVQKESMPLAQLDEARRALAVAQSQHEATQEQMQSTGPRGAEHQLALAAYAQAAASVAQAEVRVAESRLVAASAAVVLNRAVEPGEIVQPGRTLLVLARDGETLLSVQPDEKNLAEIRLGEPAQASADAFAKERFAATVHYIAPSVDPQRGTVEVRLAVAHPPAYLRPDMTVSVNIEVGRRPWALVVPQAAVQDLALTKPWVWLLRDGHLEHRRVELGLRGAGDLEIITGLLESELVVVSSSTALSAGQRVRTAALAASR